MKNIVSLQKACKDFEEDLVLYYYGETDDAERSRVVEHLSACALCQSFVDDLHRLLPQMARSEQLPQSFWDDYYRETVAKLAQQEERKHWWRALFTPMRVWMVPAFGTVAMAILVIGLLFGKGNLNLFMHHPSEKIPQEILADENQLQFFESMDLLESLGNLEIQDEHGSDSTNTQSSRVRHQSGVA
jgi:putative zinc finger protein